MCLPLHCLLALTLYFCISAILSSSFHFLLRLSAPFLELLFSLGYGEFLTFFKIGKKKENCPGCPKPQHRTIYTAFCTDAEALLRGLWGAHVCTCLCCNWETWRSYDFPKERKRHVCGSWISFPGGCFHLHHSPRPSAPTLSSSRMIRLWIESLCRKGGDAQQRGLHRKLGRLPPEPQYTELRCQGLGTKNKKWICNGQMHGGRWSQGCCSVTHQNLPEEMGCPPQCQSPNKAWGKLRTHFSIFESSLCFLWRAGGKQADSP